MQWYCQWYLLCIGMQWYDKVMHGMVFIMHLYAIVLICNGIGIGIRWYAMVQGKAMVFIMHCYAMVLEMVFIMHWHAIVLVCNGMKWYWKWYDKARQWHGIYYGLVCNGIGMEWYELVCNWYWYEMVCNGIYYALVCNGIGNGMHWYAMVLV
jgi:hypothetical protein